MTGTTEPSYVEADCNIVLVDCHEPLHVVWTGMLG